MGVCQAREVRRGRRRWERERGRCKARLAVVGSNPRHSGREGDLRRVKEVAVVVVVVVVKREEEKKKRRERRRGRRVYQKQEK